MNVALGCVAVHDFDESPGVSIPVQQAQVGPHCPDPLFSLNAGYSLYQVERQALRALVAVRPGFENPAHVGNDDSLDDGNCLLMRCQLRHTSAFCS